MFKSRYKKLVKEFKKKNYCYPDNGRSVRPWESDLRKKIQETINSARDRNESWAYSVGDWR